MRVWLVAVATTVGAVAAFISSLGEISAFAERAYEITAPRVSAFYLSVPVLRNRAVQQLVTTTYDGKACVFGHTPIDLDPDGIATDLQIAIYPRTSHGCESAEEQFRLSYAFFKLIGLTYYFVGDISGEKLPGTMVRNEGPFVVVTVSETDFPTSLILQWNGARLVERGFYEHMLSLSGRDDDEMENFEVSLEDRCLLFSGPTVTPANKSVCWSDAVAEAKRLASAPAAEELVSPSYDTVIAFESLADGPRSTANGVPGYIAEGDASGSGAPYVLDVYVGALERVYLPGTCVGVEGVERWQSFFGAWALTEPGGTDVGRLLCMVEPYRVEVRLAPS